MIWRLEIQEKEGVFDALGEGIQKDILDLGVVSVRRVRVVLVYNIEGDLARDDVEVIGRELLADRVTQDFKLYCSDNPPLENPEGHEVVEIAYNPGVMDPVEESTLKGIRDLGVVGVAAVSTARQYQLQGDIPQKDLNTIIDKVLSNKIVQHVVPRNFLFRDGKIVLPQEKAKASGVIPEVKTVDLLSASDRRLKTLSQQGQLFLNLDEMREIQKYFRKQKRDATDLELETIAQTWSEHCNHKTFRGKIEYESRDHAGTKTKLVRNLLKSTIVKATKTLDKSWCVSVFHDNAGVIKFDDQDNVCFKVETHNHPSALEPFGGANTGIGGVIRDTLGTGLGAKPVCNTDIFCFAPPDYDFKDLPSGALHPKRVMKGVVAGVRDYGNKMGIPTVNGAILFDDRYVGNPLVYCGNVGLIPKGKEFKKVHNGDLVVVAGGKTGRDGIHGATFSSGELTSDSEVVSSGAVQIGDPIQEKKVQDVLLQARAAGLYSAITDCGAGGLSSAVGEMGVETGARVDLDLVPLKYQGLSYMEIWISESQERMVMSVPPENIEALLAVFSSENVEATVIGEFTSTGRLELLYHGHQVCDLEMAFLHEGVPQITKKARWVQPRLKQPQVPCPESLTPSLLSALSHYNVCSKEWVIRQYDHEVQGGSVIKPLCGEACDGPSDAAVLMPRLGSVKGLAISNGINVRYGMIDPYWMAASCIDEAIRQIIAVGGRLDRIALLDNFCWGNPDKPDRLGAMVRCALGCYKAAVAYGTPFISGKDSLYNEYAHEGKTLSIPGTILISAIGIVDDVTHSVSMDLKSPGNLIYIVGRTADELGGSIYYDNLGELGAKVPQVDFKRGLTVFQAMEKAIKKGCAVSVHDCSEGGLGVALAEMAFAGGCGVTAFLGKVPYRGKNKQDDHILFSESNSRFVVEVPVSRQKDFERLLKGAEFGLIGQVEDSPEFVVYGVDNTVQVNAYLKDLKEAWQKPLRW